MTRIAAVDCGTNSIRLLISEYDGHTYTDVVRTMEIVRLGQGVDATGRLDPAAIDRTRAALHGYVDTMLEEDVQAVRMVATSATRDASNKDDFFTMTAEELGRIQPGAQAEVISGDEEATLSFRGAASDLPDARGRICVIDLGGGSTEFVVGTADGEVQGEISVQMGCVRLTERFMTSDPATEKEKAMARQYVQQQLDAVDQASTSKGSRRSSAAQAHSPRCPRSRRACPPMIQKRSTVLHCLSTTSFPPPRTSSKRRLTCANKTRLSMRVGQMS